MIEANLDKVLEDEGAWFDLVRSRREPIAQFLRWAAACEAGTRETSMRLENRDDIVRCRETLPLFEEEWWGVVVYSCFDSTTGTRIAASRFREPPSPTEAERALAELEFPRGAVQHHRAQATLAGARRSLISVCEKADDIRDVVFERGLTFDERFVHLMKVNVSWWGRTTCFDALLRSGALGVTGESYRPEKAYLLGSQGPAAGFARIWGVRVTGANADMCEAVLRRWTETWTDISHAVAAPWDGPPYDSADFENALCVFQEPPRAWLPDPTSF